MSTFREVLLHAAARAYTDIGITEEDAHTTEYDGHVYLTPPIIREEDHGEA